MRVSTWDPGVRRSTKHDNDNGVGGDNDNDDDGNSDNDDDDEKAGVACWQSGDERAQGSNILY